MNDQAAPWTKDRVAHRLRAVRRVLGYAEHPKKKKFAKILGVHENTANNWLKGDHYPRPEAIFQLRPYGFDWNFFFEGSLVAVPKELHEDLLKAFEQELDPNNI